MTGADQDDYLRHRVHDALDPKMPGLGAEQRVLAGAMDRLARSGSGPRSWWKPLKTTLGGAVVTVAVGGLMAGALALTLSLRGQIHPSTQTSGPTLAATQVFPGVASAIPIEASDGCSQESTAFVDADTGWLALNGGVIARTADGGRTWTDQFRPSQNNASIQDIDFINAQDGYAIVTWSGVSTAPGALPLHDQLIRTVDGGLTWSVATSTRMNCVDFLTPSIGYATTANEQLAVTRDGGTTWARVPTPGQVVAPCFQAGGAGWVATTKGVYHTSDGGAHWTLSYRPGSLGDLVSADQLECFGHTAWLSMFLGDAMNQTATVIVRTLDNGGHWQAVDNQGVGGPTPNTPSAPDILEPHPGPFQLTGPDDACLTSSNSIFVDVELTVTQDGGSSVRRHQVVSGSATALGVSPVGLSFITPTNGWLLLSSYTLEFHVDAWSGQSGAQARLTGQGPTHLILLHTVNAGATWTQVAAF